MQIDNKTTHRIWASVAIIATALASIVTYTAKDSKPVMDSIETQKIIRTELPQLKSEVLEKEQVKMKSMGRH